jgi:hypothetical protein
LGDSFFFENDGAIGLGGGGTAYLEKSGPWVQSPVLPKKKNVAPSWEWWCTPIILALRRLRQEDYKFEDSLSSIVRPCLKKK